MDKRFIEESFPVKEVSSESAREKGIRHGHISTLHLWWARRPLASSRATNYAALIPAPEDEIDWVKKKNFIIELSKWENSLNQNLVQAAKNEILIANNNVPPKVLDPFSGGGSIPLESLRLGCETYANDYNPVAVLIEKCTLEYPQKFNQSDKWSENENKLIDDIKKWANIILDESKVEIGKFYPEEEDGSIPVAYIWARTINCKNPSCGAEIPLMRQFWIVKKKNKKIAVKPIINDKKIDFEIVGQENDIPDKFDPSKGTLSRAVAKCLVCGTVSDANTTRKIFREGESSQKMIAVVYYHPKRRGKVYRVAKKEDLEIFEQAIVYYKAKKTVLQNEWGISPIPEEPLKRVPFPFGVINVWVYGMDKWGDLFNERQKLALITLTEKIRNLHDRLLIEYEPEYAKALLSFIIILFDRMVDFSSMICQWENTTEAVKHVFTRQAIPMLWDYAEGNPFSGSTGSFQNQLLYVLKSVSFSSSSSKNSAIITNSSATDLPYKNDYFDAVFTDPPYYDNVPYSYLSDYFYVWLKRTAIEVYPELFSMPLSPKTKEIVAYNQETASYDGKQFFEDMLKKSFQEIHRVLKPNGITTIVYAHKTTAGWETVINALLDSGLVVTASWPISTEMSNRLRAHNSATLASSIYIVARKFHKSGIGWFKDVKVQIKNYVPQKLDKLWEEGISGADFFIAAIGSAIEIFGKYEKVLDNEGNEIKADKLLSFVRDVVTDYTVKQILHNGIASELSPLTKFYLMWRWNYQDAVVEFDEARKLAQSAGIDISNEWNKGLITKRSSSIRVLSPGKRDINSLKDSKELIDVLHHICILWKEGKQDEMKSVLKKSGYGEGEALYKVAQAISETLPNTSSEKKMIEGFLAGRDKIMQDMRGDESQTKLL